MSLSFIHPIALVLLLFLPLLVLFTIAAARAEQVLHRTTIRRPILGWSRFHLSTLLRSLILVALVLALAGTQLVQPVKNLTVVFLVDGSDSVSPAQREWALNYINTALASRRPDDRAGVVFFGNNALVERIPSPLAALSRFTSTPVGSRTNIAEAIQLGLALFPSDTKKRLVLLSDGEENAGHAIEAARLAKVRGIPLDVVPIPIAHGNDVLIRALDAPDTAREGQDVPLTVHIQSSVASTGQLQVFTDGELVGTQEVTLPEGSSSVQVSVPGSQAGFHRYEVRMESPADTQAINNRAAAFTAVQGPPRVLIATTDASSAEPLKQALIAGGAQVEIVSPASIPSDQAQLKPYAAVVLVDVLSHDVPRAVQEALPIYVREQGGGFAMIGGRSSFGAGGWRRTPIADVLPVELDRKDTEHRPDLGLVLVIDRSGSMSESGNNGGLTKLDLAKEAVFQATLGLEQQDEIGVVVFDTMSDWVLPVQPLPDLMAIQQALSQFQADGGTDIRSGIEPAARALAGIDAKVKHVILLTDGQAESNYADLIQQMRANATTISIVSIGADANPELQQIAQLGGGRYYRVMSVSDVPRIFLSETIQVAGRDIVEETFVPVVALPAPVVRGLDQLPPLHGYNATEPRPSARTILVGPNNKPILAQWQYGLGSSVAWTSDLKGQWAQAWVSWDQFPHFSNGLLDMLLPPEQAEGLALETHSDGDRAILELTVTDGGRPLNDVRIQGRVLDPEDEGTELTFVQVGSGRYRAVTTTDTPGVYLAQVAVLNSDGSPYGRVSAGMVVAYSPEYRSAGTTPHLLGDLADVSGGMLSPDPPHLFEPPAQVAGSVQEVSLPLLWLALLLLPIDIGVRRIALRQRDLVALRHAILERLRPRPPTPVETDETMTRLRAARDRARQKHKEP